MVFTSRVVEKLRLIMFLSQSVNSSFVLGRGVQRQSGLSRVKPLAKGWFQLVLVSGRLRPASLPVPVRAWKSCLPLSVTNSSFSYSRFWASDAVFLKV